ncbi:MAG: Arc family DNA-binding protein [Croceibacterium sp.]
MTSQGVAKNAGGRPLERSEAKRAAIAVRTTPTIKDRLARSAEARGRSITQEVEARVEQSFELDDLLGHVETKQLLVELARQIAKAEAATGKLWSTDVATHEAATVLMKHAIRTARPLPPNYQQTAELRTKLEACLERKSSLTVFLLSCGAIADNRGLAALIGLGKPFYAEEDEAHWRHPNTNEEPLSPEDRILLHDTLEEWRGLDQLEINSLEQMQESVGPHIDALKAGESIAETILGGDF